MPLLHIEHGVTDLDAWLKTFDLFEPQRKAAGYKRSAFVGQPTIHTAWPSISSLNPFPPRTISTRSCAIRCGLRLALRA
jgi:hypothetical protein